MTVKAICIGSLFVTLFMSCRTPYGIKDFTKFKAQFKAECALIDVDDNILKIEAEIDNKKDFYVLDLGFKGYIFRNSILDTTIHKKDGLYKKTMVTATERFTVYYDKLIPSIKTPFVNITHPIGMEIFTQNKTNSCDLQSYSKPVLGYYTVLSFKAPRYLYLDLEKKKLCVDENFDFDKSNLQLLESSFEKDGIFIYIVINGKKQKLLFDTGSQLGISLPKEEAATFTQSDKVHTLEGILTRDAFLNLKTSIIDIYNIKEIRVSDKIEINSEVRVIDNLLQGNLGFGVIKQFNWLIDREKKKVYCSPAINDSSYSSYLTTITHYAELLNNKIQFIIKSPGDSKVELFKEIKSINNIELSTLEPCDAIKFVNELKRNEINSIVYQ